MKGPRGTCSLSQQQLGLSSTELVSINGQLPSELARQPRSLQMLDRWKATEFRQFLLYLGPLVLKDVVPRRFYKHFLSLHIAMSILLDENDEKRHAYMQYAQQLLAYFVNESTILYGNTFNVTV